MNTSVILTECPRDAMQGLHEFIPTDKKAAYINALLKCGFDRIDFGSFVSPKAIPQMKDTAEVLKRLDLSATSSRLLAIVANQQGAEQAASFDEITYLGFPFSISETFLKRNINSSFEDSFHRVEEIQSLCISKGKKLLIYISMAFGNPYDDPWDPAMVGNWVGKIAGAGIRDFALADTIGVSNPESIRQLFSHLIPMYPELSIGAHLHSTPSTWLEKIDAAWTNGCRIFDSAIGGFGGCPMAKDELTGNIATENILQFLKKNNIPNGIREDYFSKSTVLSKEIFA